MSKVRRVTGAEVRGKVMRAYEHSKPTKEERHYEKRKKALARARANKNKPMTRRMVVDEKGNPIELTAHQKSSMYREAMRLKERIRKAMLSYDQHWKPTERDIRLLQKREHSINHLKKRYKDLMEAIGASDSDLDVEKFRRRK